MQITLDEVKIYLRLDDDAEDTLLSSLILASDVYIKNATHQNADEESDLFKLAQMMLITHWFENRNSVLVGTTSKTLDFALESILNMIGFMTDDAI